MVDFLANSVTQKYYNVNFTVLLTYCELTEYEVRGSSGDGSFLSLWDTKDMHSDT